MINNYKISCLEDYDTFCKEKSGLTWLCGLPLSSSLMRDAVSNNEFPIYLEVDTSTREVAFSTFAPKDKITYSPKKEEPISLMVDKKEQGIYFIDKEGKETFFSIEDFIENPDKLIYAVEKSTSLGVGDKVRVIDAGQGYSTYTSWFEENNVSINIAARYSFGNNVPANDQEYKIIAVGKHANCSAILYAITPTDIHFFTDNTIVYLIGSKGVEKITDRKQYSWE